MCFHSVLFSDHPINIQANLFSQLICFGCPGKCGKFVFDELDCLRLYAVDDEIHEICHLVFSILVQSIFRTVGKELFPGQREFFSPLSLRILCCLISVCF